MQRLALPMLAALAGFFTAVGLVFCLVWALAVAATLGPENADGNQDFVAVGYTLGEAASPFLTAGLLAGIGILVVFARARSVC